MITIEEMQFGGMLVLTMLTLILALGVPKRSASHAGFGRSRWLMAAGTLLIAVQFLLQRIGGFRQMGVTQAVLWNLLLFMPACLLINMAVLHIQRRGSISRKEWLLGGVLCLLSTLILVATLLADGVQLAEESPALQRAEYAGAVLFVLMQGHYFRIHFTEYRRLKRAVDEYFDRERRDLLGWMARSVNLLALLAIMVPVAIFFQGAVLKVFSVMFFFSIAYCVVGFYRYGISEDVVRVEESEAVDSEEVKADREKDNADTLNDDVKGHIAEAVAQWKTSGAYCEHNLTLSSVARQMNIPQKQLRLWLRQSEYGKLATLVTALRIEEAKRMLTDHPEWTIDYIADHCGFNSREYFHQVFQEHTGTTPVKYLNKRSTTKRGN
ncbi:MAG: helix-turn-helix domain-containing protein [Prevotella sp.]|nr:helix-turn-helix domain-containing protein [Prevotella sp.]MBQ6195612.1 helix-turn-helix domain-containing protein [Prevotella sp.]